MKQSSSQEGEAVVTQWSSDEEEPEVIHRSRDPDGAEVMRRCGDETKQCPRLDHPGKTTKRGQNKTTTSSVEMRTAARD